LSSEIVTRMRKYIVPKGAQIWLLSSNYMPFDVFFTERKMVFDESDIQRKRKMPRSTGGGAHIVFKLPPNDRGYNWIEVRDQNIIVVEE